MTSRPSTSSSKRPNDAVPDDFVVNVESEDNELSFRSVQAVDVRVEDLNVSIDTSPSGLQKLFVPSARKATSTNDQFKPILQDVSAFMPAGSVTAIIGSSGSGKTSVLNSLSHRIEGGRLRTHGAILYNGNKKLSSVRSAYVMQQDVLLPTLTVRETLRYAAELRLPPPTTKAEREQVVEDVILELGLKECASTRIGNNVHKGCSGGEKRRCSLAVQMLANPSILFLDEVTTGLDAATAYQLVRTLKNLARKGRTIIVTIHQPRSEIWSLFDRVLLLATGSPVYSGLTQDCLPYFAALGHEIQSFVNPAEFLIDLAALDIRTVEAEASSSARVRKLIEAWQSHFASSHATKEEGRLTDEGNLNSVAPTAVVKQASKIRQHAGLGRQIVVLTERTFKVTWRDPMGVAGIGFEATAMGVITGWIFLQLSGDQQGIRSREGAVYSAAALQGYLVLLFDIYRLTIDIQLFDREFGEGVATVPAFLISRRLARIFLEDLPIPLVFSSIFYFMCGFRPLASQFFQFYSVTLLMQYIAVTLSTVCIAVSRDFALASFVANMAFTLQSLGCGYFVQPNQIPVWMRWLKWTAYTFYAYGALVANEFVAHTSDPAGHLYDCPEPGGTGNPACKEYTGVYIMQSLGLPSDWITRPIWVLFGFAVAFFVGAGLILQFKRVKMGISRARKNDTDLSAGKEKMADSLVGSRKVLIKLEDFGLDIYKRGPLPKSNTSFTILKSLNAQFQPDILNVIMGWV